MQTKHPLFLGDYPGELVRLADELVAKRASPSATKRSPAPFESAKRPRFDNGAICSRLLANETIQGGEWLSRVPEPLDRSILPARIRGMLLGIAIGDALGNTSESMHPTRRRQLHGEIRDYLPNRHAAGRRVGVPSDDTQLTVRTLEELLDTGCLSPIGLLERFASARIFGMGSTVREALEAFRAGQLDPTGIPSAGNGALMRIAPVLLPYLRGPQADLWLDTLTATASTHGDSMALASSVAWIEVLWTLLGATSTPSADFWFDRVLETVRNVEAPGTLYRARGGAFADFEGTLSQFLEDCRPVLARGHTTLAACELWYSGAYLLETMPSVLYVLSRHADDPEEALVRAVNDTWDNDTIASIVGGALGALHGADAFPSRWVEGLLGRTGAEDDGQLFELIERAVERFAGM